MATYANPSPQVVMTTGQAPMVISQPAVTQPGEKHRKTFKTLGYIQLTIGVLSVIIGGIASSSGVTGVILFGYHYAGIWGGIFILICGGLALATGNSPNYGTVVSGLVMAIITTLVAFVAGIMEAITANIRVLCFGSSCTGFGAFVALHAIVATLLFGGMIVAFIHSVFCCVGMCGNRNDSTTVTVVSNNPPPAPYYAQQQPQNYGQQMPQQYFPQNPTSGPYQTPQSHQPAPPMQQPIEKQAPPSYEPVA